MEKDRDKKLVIIAVLVAVFSLTIGFAAFSNVLNVGTSATVTPNNSNFSVLFSSSNTSQATANITGVGTGGATGGKAVISGTRLSGVSASFTEPGQKVTYTLYAHNTGEYVAYLSNISFGTGKNCVAGAGTTNSLVQAACDDINVSVKVGSLTANTSTTVTSHSLATGAYEEVVVTIEYTAGGSRADGIFNITFGDVSLVYSSVEGGSVEPKLISFSITSNLGADTYEYQAEEGMTWEEFVHSKYNDGKFSINNDEVTFIYGISYFVYYLEVKVTPSNEIISGNYDAVILFEKEPDPTVG